MDTQVCAVELFLFCQSDAHGMLENTVHQEPAGRDKNHIRRCTHYLTGQADAAQTARRLRTKDSIFKTFQRKVRNDNNV